MTLPLFSEADEVRAVPLEMREISSVDALLGSLAGRSWDWPGRDGGPACKLLIDRVKSAQDIPGERAACFSWCGVQFWLVGAPRLFQALCGFDPWLADSGAPATRQVDVGWPLREVVAVLNNFWFAHAADWIQPTAEMTTWGSVAEDAVALECSIWSEQAVWMDRFWLVPTVLPQAGRMAVLFSKSRLAERAVDEVPALPLVLPAVIGESNLPLTTLKSLEVGDVLAFSRSWLTGLDRLDVVWASGTLTFRILDAKRLELLEQVRQVKSAGGDLMDDELKMGDLSLEIPEGEGLKSAEDVLMDLPIRVQAVAGSLNVTVADLARIQPGDVLELDNPAQPFVKLVANGRVVGLGELVEVNGRLGVQISRWDVAS